MPERGAPPAVVLQASGPNGLAIVRALGRAGVPVIACDADPRALGLCSRYARGVRTPDPLDDPDGFAAALGDLGRTLPWRGVLFATHDEALIAVGRHEDALAPWFTRTWGSWAVMERVLDKGHQHAVARSIGFPVPATLVPRDEGDVAAAAGALRFPVVLKPRNAPEFRRRSGRQVLVARDAEGLRRAWDQLRRYDPLVSEVIPGGDHRIWSLGSYRDRAGRPLASFTGRKLRQWPPGFGTGRAAEARWDSWLAARGHRLLEALGFHGISQLETKLDPRDGRQYLIEVNPRPWLWIGLAHAAGVPLALAAYLDAVGSPRRWPDGHRSGLRWMVATRHLSAGAREVARGQWRMRQFARTLLPPVVDGVLDPRDPRPALTLLARDLRHQRRR